MIVLFDSENIYVTIRAGAMESYTPTDDITKVVEQADLLRSKLEDKKKELSEAYNKFLKEEINPAKDIIKSEIKAINKKNNPDLKAF